MTVAEFKNEFLFKYDAASNGGPDLNNYEISLCLTQAVKDIVKDYYDNYETNEKSKRVLAPLLKDHTSVITNNTNVFWPGKNYIISLPSDLQYIVLEQVKLKNCIGVPKIQITDLDHLNSILNNPFKRPNKRKIVRTEFSGTKGEVYSDEELDEYNIKYIKNPLPIIVSNFSTDGDLIGDESIEGLSVITNTELPSFIHDDIVDKAVIIAIKTLRENNLQTQFQIK